MIYFAQLPTGSVKVGFSDDVERRINQLEQRYRQPVALLHTMEGDRQTEREIHERFAHLRFGKTEQFQPGSDLMEFIGKPLLVSANAEMVEVKDPRRGPGRPVRVADDVVSMARRIADFRGIMLSDYFSESLRPAVQRDYQAMLKKLGEMK